MPTRRNILRLTTAEQSAFVAALNAMKADGTYDAFTERHHMNMMSKTPGSGGYYSATRNRGHRGPAFGPWHRWSLLDFESQLAAHGFPFLPYWAWERETGSWTSSPRTGVWAVMGGSGTVTSPFPNWHARLYSSTTRSFTYRSTAGIRRALGASVRALPSQADVSSVMALTAYDAAPCDDTSRTASFRNGLEGWLVRPGQASSMHNAVHNFIGGDMLVGTSPNDPLFWLNHANVDRLWDAWQQLPGRVQYPAVGSGFPTGHAPTSTLQFLAVSGRTIGGAMSSSALGVTYEAP